jgi:hypothetical protein
MSELMVWVVVLGLAVAIAGIYVLSGQIERVMRDTAEIIICSNKSILAELKRLTDPAAEAAEPTVGVILDRRCTHRRSRSSRMSESSVVAEQRRTPGRRIDDFPSTGQVGFAHF